MPLILGDIVVGIQGGPKGMVVDAMPDSAKVTLAYKAKVITGRYIVREYRERRDRLRLLKKAKQ